MKDSVNMTLLYDYYGQLLTDKQRECFDLYYNQEYSLAEIAAEPHDWHLRHGARREEIERCRKPQSLCSHNLFYRSFSVNPCLLARRAGSRPASLRRGRGG